MTKPNFNPVPMEVIKVNNSGPALEECFRIRKTVFVEEQQVPLSEEMDEFDTSASHFLVYDKTVPCGTARWRHTEKGVKLERFAVLPAFRGKGAGSALVQAVLEDIRKSKYSGNIIYLNAQLSAVSLYEKFGFRKSGDIFEECGISHIRMQY